MVWYGSRTSDGPATDWPAIQAEAAKYERFVVDVRELDEEREVTNQQYAYLHTVVFPSYADAIGCSLWQAEYDCKFYCGKQWELVKKIGRGLYVECSKTKLTVKQCSRWIENIIEWAAKEPRNIFIPPPDQDWKAAARRTTETRE